MVTQAKITEIVKEIEGENPGLVDIEIENDYFFIPMTVEVYNKLPEVGSTVDAELVLYSFEDYDVFENEEAFIKCKKKSMAPQSIIPIGNFSIGQENFEKSCENYINGKVISAEEDEKYYLVELECLGVIFNAMYRKDFGDKPSVGNIISSTYWVEMEIENKPNQGEDQ